MICHLSWLIRFVLFQANVLIGSLSALLLWCSCAWRNTELCLTNSKLFPCGRHCTISVMCSLASGKHDSQHWKTRFRWTSIFDLSWCVMDRSSHSKNKTLKRPGGKTTSSTSEGSPSTHTKDKSSSSTHVPELDLESLQSATVQEASASSSAEGPVIPKDNVLATLSARFSRNLNKNKLQPTASRRAVRMVCVLCDVFCVLTVFLDRIFACSWL